MLFAGLVVGLQAGEVGEARVPEALSELSIINGLAMVAVLSDERNSEILEDLVRGLLQQVDEMEASGFPYVIKTKQ